MDLVDLGPELVELGDGTEAPVDLGGVVHLMAEHVNGLTVDGAGDGEPTA
ncbi:MAG: hypothetical protein ACRDSF_16415 [Pseudonocardiaceae bacterium]